jgi:septal ring factor EnvC (AmiA/AmiB activator)
MDISNIDQSPSYQVQHIQQVETLQVEDRNAIANISNFFEKNSIESDIGSEKDESELQDASNLLSPFSQLKREDKKLTEELNKESNYNNDVLQKIKIKENSILDLQERQEKEKEIIQLKAEMEKKAEDYNKLRKENKELDDKLEELKKQENKLNQLPSNIDINITSFIKKLGLK